MKKYLILSFLFLLAVTPAIAKGTSNTSGQQMNSNLTPVVTTTANPTNKPSVSPTGNQVKNQNEVKTQNQGQEKKLEVKNQEDEQLNKNVDDSFVKVSDQVHELINTVGAKGGIGQEVKDIAQNQIKNQENIKSSLAQLQLRKYFVKFFIGSDKKTLENVEEQLEQSKLMIQQLEELKLKTKNSTDLAQLQETIDLITYQNNSLEEKIDRENQGKGMFGWLINLFNK